MGRISDSIRGFFRRKTLQENETAEAATVRGMLMSTFDSYEEMFDSFKAPDAPIAGIDPFGNEIEPRPLKMSDLEPYVRDWTLLDLGYPSHGLWLLSWKSGDDYRLMEFTVEGVEAVHLNVRVGIPWPWDLPDSVNNIRFPDFVLTS